MFLGSTSLRENGIYSSASAYNAGQDVGDVLSIIAGGAEAIRGAGEVTAGVLGTPETAGASLSISAKGVVDITHGGLMATSGATKLFSKKGRANEKSSNGYSKTSGRNEPHSNLKAREVAKEKMEAAQEKLKAMEKDKNSTKNERRKVKNEIFNSCTPALNKLVEIAIRLDEITDEVSEQSARTTIIQGRSRRKARI